MNRMALREFQDWMREKYERRGELATILGRLRRICEKNGRSYEDIEKTVLGTIRIGRDAMGVAEVIQLCKELGGMGFQHVIFNMPNSHEIIPIEKIGEEVIPEVRYI